MTYAVSFACGVLLLAAAVFAITGHPKSLHRWCDCFCKSSKEHPIVPNQQVKHPRLYKAGWPLGILGVLGLAAGVGLSFRADGRFKTGR